MVEAIEYEPLSKYRGGSPDLFQARGFIPDMSHIGTRQSLYAVVGDMGSLGNKRSLFKDSIIDNPWFSDKEAIDLKLFGQFSMTSLRSALATRYSSRE